MNRHSQRGVALVITLIMLAVVTVMAVLFLGTSRRDRASVRVTEDQTDARLLADAALARAQAQIVSRMMSSNSLLAYDLLVSTNYSNGGFISGNATTDNASYTYANGQPLNNANDVIQNVANLYFDPRPPVYVPINGPRTNDFRFFIDLNRNGRFETNGLLPILDANGRTVQRNNQNVLDYFTGDPEWIGLLQRPEYRHSSSNRFVGRYAFIALPAGKSLDLNFIHNAAKWANRSGTALANNDGFYRNQGVGSWEINLAAFLRDLNTNQWNDYVYQNDMNTANRGLPFDDAANILNYRYERSIRRLATVGDLYRDGPFAFQNDFIDGYSRGSAIQPAPPGDYDIDLTGLPWSGSDNPLDLRSIQEFFDTNKIRGRFTERLTNSMVTARRSSYDRYTYYRLLSQMGVDSVPANRGKLNLNYDNVNTQTTNFIPWTPVNFFIKAADRMIQASLTRVPVFVKVAGRDVLSTNYFLGDMPVSSNISVTNILIYPRSEYSAELHRLLQVAANIFDASTNRYYDTATGLAFPSVFKPVYANVNGGAKISGYIEVTNSSQVMGSGIRWVDLRGTSTAPAVGGDNVMIPGIPLVIGAKKGFPNFNEYQAQTEVKVSRKVQATKGKVDDTTIQNLSQMYVLGISNLFAVELFNSYSTNYTRATDLIISNHVAMALRDGTRSNAVTANYAVGTNLVGALNKKNWTPNEVFAVSNKVAFISDSAYSALQGGRFTPLIQNPVFDRDPQMAVPDWELFITNRVTYLAIDAQTRRVIDYVALDNLTSSLNISNILCAPRNQFNDSHGFDVSQFWSSARGAGNRWPAGITNQIYVSSFNVLSNDVWQSASLNPVSGRDQQNAIDGFRNYLGMPPLFGVPSAPSTEEFKQVPFTPSKKFYLTMSWQANDPLVHYHPMDLYDPAYSSPTNITVLRPPEIAVAPSNIGFENDRYSPWSGKPGKESQAMDFDPAFKDPMVMNSDSWNFPTNKFPTIGWLGRVHRGTPWQTLFLKANVADTNIWLKWAGHRGTHPTNDWRLMDVFTTAPNDNAARGLLSVNQTNRAAWSAVLSGVATVTNTGVDAVVKRAGQKRTRTGLAFGPQQVEPSSVHLDGIVQGIMVKQAQWPNRVFPDLGSILSVPELTTSSPFLRTTNTLLNAQTEYGLTDEAYERIPQQILSLLKADEPRLVVYAFGQSLKPAGPPYSLPSLVMSGPYAGMCTNYQITGEVWAKAVLRVDGTPQHPKVVVESYNVLPGD